MLTKAQKKCLSLNHLSWGHTRKYLRVTSSGINCVYSTNAQVLASSARYRYLQLASFVISDNHHTTAKGVAIPSLLRLHIFLHRMTHNKNTRRKHILSIYICLSNAILTMRLEMAFGLYRLCFCLSRCYRQRRLRCRCLSRYCATIGVTDKCRNLTPL